MKNLLFILFVLIFLAAQTLFDARCLGQSKLKTGTQCTAGGKTECAAFKLSGIVGQTIQAERTSSANFKILGNLNSYFGDREAPIISQAQTITTSEANKDITVTANITDNINVQDASLFYCQGGDSQFISKTMSQSGNDYTGTIPATAAGSRGVEYYISATDVNNNIKKTDTYSIQIVLSGNGIEKTTAQPAGTAQTAYRLVSIPLAADNKKPANVLEDDLGTYNNTNWRFFELKSDQSYTEYPNTGDMVAGKGFWLIVKAADKKINTGAGKTNPLDTQFEISLSQGWTFVGNPFNFALPLSHVKMQNDSALDIRSFTGSWSEVKNSLTPFEGYAVYSTSGTKLLLDPDLSATTQFMKPIDVENNEEWKIHIEALCQDARDKDARVVISSRASEKYDRLDRPEPPVIGEYVSVYFPHPEWKEPSRNFSTDARPMSFNGEIWDFEVKTNIRDNVKLNFKGLDSVPQEYEIWFIDETNKVVQNLREKDYCQIGLTRELPKKLKLAVGQSDFIKDQFDKHNVIPTEFQLYQNFPNPFNPTTTIRFALPTDEKVSLKIYNFIGQQVVTLLDNNKKKAGYHTIIWDGTNRFGESVASGMYLYYLKAGQFTDTKKMVFIK